jgi:hypothetical protein
MTAKGPSVNRLIAIGASAVVAAAGLLSAAPGAAAKDRDDVKVVGSCTRTSASELKLSAEDGRIEVEFEVDQNRVGVRWSVVIRRNGRIVHRAVKVTRRPSGSFTARVVTANAAGQDRFVATATRAGESCRAAGAF